MDRAERNELVEKNIGLVHACANKFRGKVKMKKQKK